METAVELVPSHRFPGAFVPEETLRVQGANYLYATDIGVMRIHVVEAFTLDPGTEYVYRVGSGLKEEWSCTGIFSTEAPECMPFTFLYFTDNQAAFANASVRNGYGVWGNIFRQAVMQYPEAKFMLHSGDFVEDGSRQLHWEYFFLTLLRIICLSSFFCTRCRKS